MDTTTKQTAVRTVRLQAHKVPVLGAKSGREIKFKYLKEMAH